MLEIMLEIMLQSLQSITLIKSLQANTLPIDVCLCKTYRSLTLSELSHWTSDRRQESKSPHSNVLGVLATKYRS